MTKNTSSSESVPAGRRSTPKSAETRARIIDGARQTLETHGIEAVTTRKIAATAGVRLAALHYHFENKEALLLAVLDDLVEDMAVSFRAELGGTLEGEERIERLIRSIWRYVRRTRNKQIAQIELTLYALRTRGSEWIAAKQYDSYIRVYKDLVVDGTLAEEEAERIGPAMARFILSGVDGLILQAFALRDDAAAEAAVEAFILASRMYYRFLTSGGG